MKPSHNEPEAVRRFRHLWFRLRPWGDDWAKQARKARQLVSEIRRFRREQKETPVGKRTPSEIGRYAQRKGRQAELQDHKELRAMGFTVTDYRALEAANVITGIDFSFSGKRIMGPTYYVQRRKAPRPSLKKAYDEVTRATAGKSVFAVPVAHVTFDRGADVAVLPWGEFKQLCYDADRVGRDED